VPIAGSSTNGYLSVSSETAPAECAVLSLSFQNTSKLWSITNSGKVALPLADIGFLCCLLLRYCHAQEHCYGLRRSDPDGDANGDGYQDMGWIIEIDPATRTVINQDATGA
jgi:hypothetical protein